MLGLVYWWPGWYVRIWICVLCVGAMALAMAATMIKEYIIDTKKEGGQGVNSNQ